jgi:hypothetical protein
MGRLLKFPYLYPAGEECFPGFGSDSMAAADPEAFQAAMQRLDEMRARPDPLARRQGFGVPSREEILSRYPKRDLPI